jgi:hypothetical protein
MEHSLIVALDGVFSAAFAEPWSYLDHLLSPIYVPGIVPGIDSLPSTTLLSLDPHRICRLILIQSIASTCNPQNP